MPIFIGDVHGKLSQYKAIINEHKNTIQVGDMGVGFRRWHHGEWRANPPYDLMVEAKARFIRGNHDNPAVCAHHTQWIPDGYVEDDMMFVGGAYSIDRAYRYPEFDWWEDEEVSDEEFSLIYQIYNTVKPACMVTHDCPLRIIDHLHSHRIGEGSRTQVNFDRLFTIHKPKVWIFGHHHMSFDQVIEDTRFVCLAELEVKEIDWRIYYA